MEPSKPKPRFDVRRNADDTALVIGMYLEDGTYAAISLFDTDDSATLSGKFKAISDRIKPDPAPPGSYRGRR